MQERNKTVLGLAALDGLLVALIAALLSAVAIFVVSSPTWWLWCLDRLDARDWNHWTWTAVVAALIAILAVICYWPRARESEKPTSQLRVESREGKRKGRIEDSRLITDN